MTLLHMQYNKKTKKNEFLIKKQLCHVQTYRLDIQDYIIL